MVTWRTFNFLLFVQSSTRCLFIWSFSLIIKAKCTHYNFFLCAAGFIPLIFHCFRYESADSCLPLRAAAPLAKVVDDEKAKYIFYNVFFFTMKESHANISNSLLNEIRKYPTSKYSSILNWPCEISLMLLYHLLLRHALCLRWESTISFVVMMIYEFGMLAGLWRGFLTLYWTHFLFSLNFFSVQCSSLSFHSFEWNVADSMIVAVENLQIPFWMQTKSNLIFKAALILQACRLFWWRRRKSTCQKSSSFRFPHLNHPLSILQIKYKYIYNATKSQIW